MITARALGLLMHLASNGLVGGVKALSGVFTEGRDALYSAVNELIRAGLVKTTRQVIGSRYCTVTEVTDEGFHFLESRMANFLETRILIQQSLHNSPLTSNSILSSSNNNTEQVGEEYTNTLSIGVESMSFLGQIEEDWDDVNEQKRRARAEKQKEYEERQASKKSDRKAHRSTKKIDDWTPMDVAYEFAFRLEGLWRIPPWRVGETRFAYALSSFRKKFNTTADIELKIMDMFFAKYAHETSITDADMMWRMFIQQAPSMVEDAKRQSYTDADMVAAKQSTNKSWEKL